MEKDQKKLKSIRIVGLLIGITSIVLIFVAKYLAPDFVASNLSQDGILDPRTIADINIFRIATGAIGLLGLLIALLFFSKPYLFKTLVYHTAIKNGYLNIIIGIFLVLSLLIGARPVIKSINNWQKLIENNDSHSLRLKLHPWYSRQHVIWEFIQNNISQDKPILINSNNCPNHFFAYHLAPRPVYKYSDIFAAKLDRAGRKYYVLNMTMERGKDIKWSITEGQCIGDPSSKRGGVIKK